MKPDSSQSLICIITGATSGIGKATAISLAQRGFSIILVGRNEKKCQATSEKIRKLLHQNASIEYLVGDLSNLHEVQRIAHEIKNHHNHIDVLINNVGARFMKYHKNQAGIEMSFALNHLSGFFLTGILLDLLKNSTQGRIINVSSGAHAKALDLDSLVSPLPYDGRKAYSQSKLCNLLFTLELSKRLSGSKITVNAVDPGGTATNFNRNNGLHFWLRHILAHIVAQDLVGPKKGAETPVYLAHEEKLANVTGKLFHNCNIINSFPGSYRTHDAKALWLLSENLVTIDGKKTPE